MRLRYSLVSIIYSFSLIAVRIPTTFAMIRPSMCIIGLKMVGFERLAQIPSLIRTTCIHSLFTFWNMMSLSLLLQWF